MIQVIHQNFEIFCINIYQNEFNHKKKVSIFHKLNQWIINWQYYYKKNLLITGDLNNKTNPINTLHVLNGDILETFKRPNGK